MNRRIGIFWIVAACLAVSFPATARAEASREYQLKAAFLFNFVQFVQWPPDAFANDKAPMVLAVVGDDPFGGALEKAVAGKTVAGRPLAVKHLAGGEDLKGVHLLFMPAGSEADLGPLLRKAGRLPVLTVGETDRFMADGGMIRFFEDDNKLRFEINPEAAQRARLRVSSRLLKLARLRGQ